MRSDIHPTYYHNTVVTCACGNSFTTGSTKQKLAIDVCAACHPFFTGQMKFVDTQGRVERFQAKMNAVHVVKKHKRKTETSGAPQSLKEMLKQARKKVT